jgi:hypothetical protein
MSRPANWKNYEDFAAGIDTNRLPGTDALVGQRFEVAFAPADRSVAPTVPAGDSLADRSVRDSLADRSVAGSRLGLEFTARDQLRWQADSQGGTDWYEAILVAPTTFFLDVTFKSRPREAQTLLVNTTTRQVLSVKSIARETPVAGQPLVEQIFEVGLLAGGPAAPQAIVPHPTRDLIGMRAFYRYSPNHLYEHTYLSSERYAWQCLVGEQRGHGDVDLASTYKFAADQYLFTFREFKIPVASVFFLNFGDLRSTGKFLGLTRDGAVQNNPAGAFIHRASMTFYDTGAAPV